jgi:hypothetical protein
MYPGEAILLHGTLPPAHLDAVRWWKEPALAAVGPSRPANNSSGTSCVTTCPLTDVAATAVDVAIDPATIETARDQLPKAAPVVVATTNQQGHLSEPPAKRSVVPRV